LFAQQGECGLPSDSGTATPTASQRTAAALPSSMPPEIDGHPILARLGEGGIGVVYRARDRKLGRDVALKMLRAGPWAADEERERFRRETAAMAQLRHPHIVPIFRQGEHQGQPYFTMSLIEGGSLKEHLPQFQAGPRLAVGLMVKVARAVHYLHEHNILHRDLKPHNILLGKDGEPYVSDFGLAKFLDTDLELTATGVVMGTRPYMAPEQAAGRTRQLTPATDVWALGVMLYELLAGRRPFTAAEDGGVREQILAAEPPTLTSSRPDLSRSLEAVVLKCLEKEAARRFASAGELADELQRWLDTGCALTRPPRAGSRLWARVRRHPVLAVALAGVLATALVLWFLWARFDSDRPLRQMRQELADGQPLRFPAPDGTLRWFAWRAGKTEFLPQPPGSASIGLTGYEVALLELLPDVPLDAYQFTAEVNHEHGDFSDVGLYFGLKAYDAPRGAILFFASLTFTDVEEDPGHDVAGGNRAMLNLNCYREENKAKGIPSLSLSRARGTKVGLFPPAKAPAGKGPWRRLTVQVQPDRIKVAWSGEAAAELSRAAFLQKATGRLAATKEIAQPAVRFPPQGGIGLMVGRGQATFRNVELAPLRE
jgi:serine/threonine-protein kinase